jgi:hypothetical protein
VHGNLAVHGWFAPLLVLELACGFGLVALSRRRRLKRRTVIWASAAASISLLTSLSVPVAWDSWARAIQFDGTDPVSTGCVNEETTSIANEWIINTDNGKEVATVRQMYSPQCDTTWLRVLTSDADLSTSKTIGRGSEGWLWGFTTQAITDPATPQWTFGQQIVSQGCATVVVHFLDQSGRIVNDLTVACP